MVSNEADRQALDQIQATLAEVLRRIDLITADVAGLDQRFHETLARLTHFRDDLTGADDETHRAVAEEIETFVGQKILRLAYMRARATEGGLTGRQTAQLVSKLCEAYLVPSEIDLTRVRRLLRARKDDGCWKAAGEAALQAKRILRSARERGIEFSWDYECDEGFPLDESTQRAWSNCDPASDVSFVVVPGYTVDGVRYLLQQVFTESAAAAGRD
ncbi:hypothetical protein [Streptomyces sp. NPDC002054]|uniref:hypothetical protein n=1 Tax=Streptomyces sp. NPDC002054 TaxID=3154663 RepID=UPI00332C603E